MNAMPMKSQMPGAMPPAQTNVGDPRTRYPSAAEIPELKLEKMEAPAEQQPVIQALQTLQQYVLSAEQQQQPQAAILKQHLIEFMKGMMTADGGAGEAAGVGQQPGAPEEAQMAFDPFKPPEESAPAMKGNNRNRNTAIQPL